MYRLLILDDEPEIVEGLSDMLQGRHLPFKEIRMAYSAAEALAQFMESPADIILADIRMPQMDGLDFYERIKERRADCKVVYLTGYSDFAYAQRAMKLGASDYLLKPVDDDEVVNCLSKVIEQLDRDREQMMRLERAEGKIRTVLPLAQSDWLRSLLHDHTEMDPRKIASGFAALQIPLDISRDVHIFLIRIDEWNEKFRRRDDSLIEFAVQNMVDDMLMRTCRLIALRIEQGMIAVTLQQTGNGQDFVNDILTERLEEVQDTGFRVLGVVMSLALLPRSIAWQDWPRMIRGLISKLKLTLPKGTLLLHDPDIDQRQHSDAVDLQHLHQELDLAIQGRDMDAFSHCLDRMLPLEEQGQEDRVSPPPPALAYMSIANWMVGVIFQYNLNILLRTDFIEKLTNYYQHRGAEDIRSFLMTAFTTILDKIGEYERNPSGVLIEHLKEYIDSHLDEDLSLNKLALKVHMNPSYLSRLFSQHTGEQLSAYITRKKISYAKRLLSGEQLKVGEIAKKVGYDNPNYFAKVFRKATGTTPQDYRKLR